MFRFGSGIPSASPLMIEMGMHPTLLSAACSGRIIKESLGKKGMGYAGGRPPLLAVLFPNTKIISNWVMGGVLYSICNSKILNWLFLGASKILLEVLFDIIHSLLWFHTFKYRYNPTYSHKDTNEYNDMTCGIVFKGCYVPIFSCECHDNFNLKKNKLKFHLPMQCRRRPKTYLSLRVSFLGVPL